MRNSLNGVAWLIPYCARHHPLQSETQRVPGTPSTLARNEQILSARCASTKGSPAAPPLVLVCATREHGGLAWPPRLSALRQPRPLPEVFTHTKA